MLYSCIFKTTPIHSPKRHCTPSATCHTGRQTGHVCLRGSRHAKTVQPVLKRAHTATSRQVSGNQDKAEKEKVMKAIEKEEEKEEEEKEEEEECIRVSFAMCTFISWQRQPSSLWSSERSLNHSGTGVVTTPLACSLLTYSSSSACFCKTTRQKKTENNVISTVNTTAPASWLEEDSPEKSQSS